ncbi:MAG: isocitrate/isopropylmalate dehydrogenase family protein [Dethiosulfatibacter sp.]|nr:isocitrate/isopropylmalate dehydrogenase family protein [Dethiosulfatibacter sp.]
MANYRFGVLKGDDIGLEIVPVAVQVIKTAVEKYSDITIDWIDLPIGYPSYLSTGETLPEETLKTLYSLDGWILGPIGHMAYPKDDPKAINPHPILRRDFDLVSNIRPAKSYPSIQSIHQNVDIVIVRENNEGFQPDRNMHKGKGEFMPTPDIAMSVRVITKRNSEMVCRVAMDLARQRNGKKKVTAIHKNTVFKLGCGLFVDTCRGVSEEYPDITFDTAVVDTFAMQMVMNPQKYDVVVTTNMFGDILSDEAAGLVGGLGMAPGLCVGPDYVMAQATHGSAPDISGKNIANPYAMVMSAQMMLSWVGNKKNDESAIKAAENVQTGIEKVLNEKLYVTPDLGGTASTDEMGKAICEAIRNI